MSMFGMCFSRHCRHTIVEFLIGHFMHHVFKTSLYAWAGHDVRPQRIPPQCLENSFCHRRLLLIASSTRCFQRVLLINILRNNVKWISDSSLSDSVAISGFLDFAVSVGWPNLQAYPGWESWLVRLIRLSPVG